MDPVYVQLREYARQIVSRYPDPRFYADCADASAWSGNFLATDPVVSRVRRFVTARLNENFGHGLCHAIKVTLDAGALMVVESDGLRRSCAETAGRVRHVQCAGLLHDILRDGPDHAVAGAAFAGRLLTRFPLPPRAVQHICSAIRGHEAFKQYTPPTSAEARLLGACLYDADKFRWGPDNFTDTIWNMVSFAHLPLSTFMRHYPRGMESLTRIRGTFRSPTGQRYGPEFIDLGLAIGWQLYDVIRSEFAGAL